MGDIAKRPHGWISHKPANSDLFGRLELALKLLNLIEPTPFDFGRQAAIT